MSIAATSLGVAASFPSVVFGTSSNYFDWEGTVFGCAASLRICTDSRSQAQRITERCLEEARRLERIFSLFIPGSAIRALNSAGSLSNPPHELLELLEYALTLGTLSQGRFDVTVQPLWSYLFYLSGAQPEPKEVEQLLALVNFRKVNISSREISFEKPGMEITLNGIAQGYITDQITSILREEGLSDVFVNFGEVFGLGNSQLGKPWKVGLRAVAHDEIYSSVEIRNRAVATSAASGLEADRDFKHLIDSSTGKSCEYFKALSVVADTATEADGLSTALSLLPKKQHNSILQHFPGAEVQLV